MTDNAPPSHDAASEDVLFGPIAEVYRKKLQATDDMLPAKVISYDRATNRVSVQILITLLTTLQQRVPRPLLDALPVYQIGGGGFILSFNLQPGNLGWVKASDRDISLFLQSYAEAEPNTKRLHSFSDAVFYPDVMTNYTIASEDAANAVLQSLNGSVKIALSTNKIKMAAPLVEIVSPSVLIDSAQVTITGNLQVDGDIVANGEVTAGVIPLTTHKHSGVIAGGDDTGAPIP